MRAIEQDSERNCLSKESNEQVSGNTEDPARNFR